MLEHRSIGRMHYVGSDLLFHRKGGAERCGFISHFVRRFCRQVSTNLKGGMFSSAEEDFLRQPTGLVCPSPEFGFQLPNSPQQNAFSLSSTASRRRIW